MKVITEAPIYNYADGDGDFSYAKGDKKQKKEKDPNAPTWYQKAYQGLKGAVESDYGKAVVGVGAQKAQNWASTGSTTGDGLPIQIQDGAFNTGGKFDTPPVDDDKNKKQGMGIWTKVAIGVGIVTVLGVATYYVLKSKKGKSSK